MDFTDFVKKCEDSIKNSQVEVGPVLHDNKIINTEIKEIMYVLKQGTARFVNCNFNFNFRQ